MRRWMWWLVPAVAVLLVLAVGMTWALLDRPTGRIVAGPPADGGRFDSPADLVTALNKAGLPCTGFRKVADPTGAVADGRCMAKVGGSTEEIVVRTYASHADAMDDAEWLVQFIADELGDYSGAAVVGKNWAVRGHHSYVERVQGSFGGELVEAT